MGRGLIATLGSVLILALVAAGCGGDGDSAELSKAEFVKQGDAICAKTENQKDAELEDAFIARNESGKPLNKAFERSLVTTVALPPVITMTEELSDLGAPDEEAEAIIAAYERGIEGIEKDPGSVLDGSNPFAEADGLAAKYGFKACAEI